MFKSPVAGVLLIAISLVPFAACGPRQPPSIVVILVDDLGAFDLPSYGHPYHRTPNIDRLARDGLRFTRAYAAAPVCAPTRAAFMTGRSPARLHLTHSLPPLPQPLAARPAETRGPAAERVTEPQSATWLDAGEVTIAERLREQGYRTALIGKWHLGRGQSAPSSQGFDVTIGGEEEAAPRSFFPPYGLSRLPDGKAGEYLTDRLTDEALAFLEASAGKPFFLVLSHFAVHTPIEASADRVEEWRRRMAEVEGVGDLSPGSLRPAYAAMIESVDESVGRVLAKLEELDLGRDTLVVLTSDNGAVVETPDTGVAVSSNGPWRGGKATLYEGGLRVPLVVRWPAVVAAATETDAVTGTTDWFPTLLDIAGAGNADGGASALDGSALDRSALDGESLVRVLRGESPRAERTLHFDYPHYIAGYRHDPGRETWWNTPGAAVVAGAMKLIRRFDSADELYDLAADPGETRDLASGRADEVAQLGAELDRWLAAQGADLPRPNLAYDAGAFAREVELSVAALGRSSEWTPNGACTTQVQDGNLVLDCEDTPFIVGPEMVLRGPLRVAVRYQASATRGAAALWYRAVDKPEFGGDRVALVPVVEPGVSAGLIEHEGTIRQLRIDFGRGKGGRAKIDWIRVEQHGKAEAKTLVEWSFDRAEAGADGR
jgi:arylsulfatase A-like enzyme